jgi:hypothetical protein
MAPQLRLRKAVDDTTLVRCAVGTGIIREEVWQDADGRVAKYNLAFINHLLCASDNGRVLGYDNSHGSHHRHLRGTVQAFPYAGYDRLLERFLREVQILREEKT